MNYEKLNHIAAQPGLITQQDAQELEELTRNFPYFATPYILLSHYYLKNNDYRYEDTLQKTALRVENRTWLYDYLHQDTKIQEPELLPELDEEVEEVGIFEPNSTNTSEIPVDSEPIEQTPRFFEIDLEPLDLEVLSNSHLEEEVYSEIDSFDNSTLLHILDKESEDLETDNSISKEEHLLLESLGSSSILVPYSEKEEALEEISETKKAEEDFIPPTNGSLSISTLVEQEDEIFEEITDDFSITDLKPEVKEQVLIPETTLESTNIQPIVETKAPTKPIFTSAVYNIEDFYPPVKEEKNPTDFFSWLSNPKIQEPEDEMGQTNDSKEEKKETLIEKFLRTNPGISRPKNDFFSPSEFAKKSELLSDDLATETLANVYLSQGNPIKAIKIYEKLGLNFPNKSTYFAALISKTKKEHNL